MIQDVKTINILIAEDDDDHYFLTEKIIKASPLHAQLHRAIDGEDLINQLLDKASILDQRIIEQPDLIILDINMPRKDGWEVLQEIKAHPSLRHIPVIILTTSDVDEDKFRGYALGANSYIRKPTDYKKWMEMIHMINRYWFDIVELPRKGGQNE